MARRFVSMDTMTMLPMLVRHTAITVRNGLMAESLLARARGTAMADTGAAGAITDAGFTGARGMAAEATDVKVTRVAGIAAATTEVVMREATPAEEVASMAVVGSTVAGEGPTAVGTDN
jgi:hypothetical protein